MTHWQGLSVESRETFWRSLQTFNATRIGIALVLLLYLTVNNHGLGIEGAPLLYVESCVAYLLLAIGFGMLTVYVRRRFMLQLAAQIAVDLVVISLLYISTGSRSGLGILFLFPLAGAAILAPLVLALFSASLATLFLLGESLYEHFVNNAQSQVLQAGVYGAAFFAVVLLLSRLADRLIREQELAARHGNDLKIQQAINDIVLADVDDGILVAGRDGRLYGCNPAARRILGLGQEDAHRLDQLASLAPIAQAFEAWLAQLQPDLRTAADAAFVTIKPGHDGAQAEHPGAPSAWRERSAHLKLRFARVETPDRAAGRCVIFIQDVSAIEDQAQQLKLASMGRLTASIAHEVRNPLSAIGHATALMAEDLTDPASTRLLRIVSDNVARVNRMVEDILQLSRKVQPHGEPLVLDAFLYELRNEFQETHGLAENTVWLGASGGAAIRFDALHLREVLVNLLNNAVRYASGTPGSMRLWAVDAGAGRIELHVQDDGPGITPEVRAHLFEPFYTTSSKGTGLGLYLARELCLNNDATLDYEYRFDTRAFGMRKTSGRFVITCAQPLS
jgi:two-component system sensor histidine kinase PilS (NtrC family)